MHAIGDAFTKRQPRAVRVRRIPEPGPARGHPDVYRFPLRRRSVWVAKNEVGSGTQIRIEAFSRSERTVRCRVQCDSLELHFEILVPASCRHWLDLPRHRWLVFGRICDLELSQLLPTRRYVGPEESDVNMISPHRETGECDWEKCTGRIAVGDTSDADGAARVYTILVPDVKLNGGIPVGNGSVMLKPHSKSMTSAAAETVRCLRAGEVFSQPLRRAVIETLVSASHSYLPAVGNLFEADLCAIRQGRRLQCTWLRKQQQDDGDQPFGSCAHSVYLRWTSGGDCFNANPST